MTTESPQPSPHDIPVASRLRKSRGRWRIFAFVALAIAVLAGAARFVSEGAPGADQIARIEISGTITSDAARQKLIAELAEDDDVKALLVVINSPGGTTAGGEELYESLNGVRATKPVVSVINELGASAAYMTALGTDRIFARRLSIVGSIGVLYQHINAGKLLDTIGVDLDKVASGPLKAEPDFDEPMTGQVRESISALVNDSFNWFVDLVAERRNMDRNQALALADGRIVTGRMGIQTGLIDAIGGEAEAIAWLESERAIAADLPVTRRFPPPSDGIGQWTRWLGQEAKAALGLPSGPIVLDGLVSLWQVEPLLATSR